MPPQIQALLENKKMLYAVIGGVLAILVVVLVMMHPWAPTKVESGAKTVETSQLVIATVDSIGKAIEIQALMAREGIHIDKMDGDGGKVILSLPKEATYDDKDRALISLVQSGLMDRNIGLEAFDKGDLTASREEKRIKLVRAQQGELARLIRKIKPVEDASISLSIPEPTIFKSEMKPMSASVQVTIPNGERLSKDKVRSIINLMVGSIQGLDAQHLALADTNGNTYNSVLDVGSELNDKLEEQDQYMKQKVASQLDRLVGPGHYVVTVSTLLREAAKETMVQKYDPEESAVTTKQNFTEKLNANNGKMSATGPASSFVPSGMEAATSNGGAGGGSNRGYVRNGSEVSYANGKTQWVETSLPGMLEDISIAVTIDKNYLPTMPLASLKELLARSASPKVDPNSVSIVETDLQKPSLISKSGSSGLDMNNGESSQNKDLTWIAFPVVTVLLVVLAFVFFAIMRGGKNSNPVDTAQIQQNQLELQQLKEFTAQQMSALQASQQQAQMLIDAQQKQILASNQQGELAAQRISQANDLKQTLSELKEAVNEESLEEDDLDLQIKTWIESS